MSNVHEHHIEYFKAPSKYFWRWSDNDEAIEWSLGGKTICIKEELINILSSLDVEHIPSPGSVLLAIAACSKEFCEEQTKILTHYNLAIGAHVELLDNAIEFLSIIPRLPEKFRTGNAKIHLLNHIFKQADHTYAAKINLKFALAELQEGRWLNQLNSGAQATANLFNTDLGYFARAKKETPTVESLVQLLKTGLNETPEAIPAEVPLPATGGLFEQLSQDPQFSVLARLAEKLFAVLNIPMHSKGSGNYPYGGISDITNRGSYDKLLLSELAHDDLTLTARLVNGEALYYRREEPPEKPTSRRVLLIDSTLKMWGIPRIFATASALAFAHNLKNREETEAFILLGDSYNAANLSEVAGIKQSMSVLHHALHCGKALQLFIEEQSLTDEDEIVLITDEQSLQSPLFMMAYSTNRDSISYLITVNRNGQISFRENINGRSKILGAAKLDLEEILKDPPKVKRQGKEFTIQLPNFYNHNPFPLLLPLPVKTEILTHCEYQGNLIIVNRQSQILLLRSGGKGAIELVEYIGKIHQCRSVVTDTEVPLVVVITSTGKLHVYFFNRDDGEYESSFVDLSDYVLEPKQIHIRNRKVYIRTLNGYFLLDPYTFSSLSPVENSEAHNWSLIHEDKELPHKNTTQFGQYFRKPRHYSPMFRAKTVFISKEKQLVFGNFALTLQKNNQQFQWKEYNNDGEQAIHVAEKTFVVPKSLDNPQIRFSLRKFRDGSEVLMDSRGIIHLRSSNKKLPEMSILFISGTFTAAWSSDGMFSGAESFYGPFAIPMNDLQAFTFDEYYIQPFIEHILKNETSAKI